MNIVLDLADTLGSEIYVRQARALQRCRDQQAVLRKCKVPTLVMCGQCDKIKPIKRHRFMAELTPNAVLKVIEKVGHFPTLEQPQATTAALLGWMKIPLVLH